MRHLLTNLELQHFDSSLGTAAEYIDKFTKLKMLKVVTSNQLNTFQELLPILQNSTLTALHFCLTKEDKRGFFKEYLATKTEDEQAQLKDNLSKISKLELYSCRFVNRDVFNFIGKYMPNLSGLKVRNASIRSWTRRELDYFCGFMLDLIVSAKHACKLSHRMNVGELADCFSTIARNVYQRIPERYANDNRRWFQMNISPKSDKFANNRVLGVRLVAHEMLRIVNLTMNDSMELDRVVNDCFLETGPIREIEYFIFELLKNSGGPGSGLRTNYRVFEIILEKMPQLKRVYIDVPKTYGNDQERMQNGLVLPFVDYAVFKASTDTDIHTLLNGCCSMFPNLKQLTFYRYCGLWQRTMGEFRLVLPEYSLEVLSVDVTDAIAESLLAGITSEEGFFVLEVEVINISVRHSYKVSLHDMSCTQLSSNDLKGLARGKDYLRVHITVNTLKYLKLLLSGTKPSLTTMDGYLRGGFHYSYFEHKTTICIDAL